MRDFTSSVIADWGREIPGLDTSSMEIVHRILRAGQILQVQMDSVAAVRGLSHKGDFDVLGALRRIGPPYEQTPSRLAKAVQLTTGGMTNRLDRLEALGLVKRRPDPSDRRGVLVGLTPEGHDVVSEALATILAEQQRMLVPLTAKDRVELASLMELLLAGLGDREERSAVVA